MMLTVSILINGQPLFTRSCFREEEGKYRVDDGSIIEHNYNDGAIKLAHKLLDTMYELQREQKIDQYYQILQRTPIFKVEPIELEKRKKEKGKNKCKKMK